MSIPHLPEVESQMNQYFESQNTMALADSTKALYNAVIRKKLLPFCQEQEIYKLNEKLKEKAILLFWSKTTPRPVFFTPETAIHLDKHLEAFFPDPAKDSFKKIFPGKNMIYKIIDSMFKDLDLKIKGDGRGPHTFRHYVATSLRYNFRMDLDHIARLLGDTQKTISTRYLHPTAEMLHNLINKASGW